MTFKETQVQMIVVMKTLTVIENQKNRLCDADAASSDNAAHSIQRFGLVGSFATHERPSRYSTSLIYSIAGHARQANLFELVVN